MSRFCAVVHFDGAPIDSDTLQKMAHGSSSPSKAIAYAWPTPAVALAHQSFHDRTETQGLACPPLRSTDERLTITADVRLDNRNELISLLQLKGHCISPLATDEELILHSYQEWGPSCVHYFDGDFAFAIWDQHTQQLFCVRDPLGVKALYYCVLGTQFLVASEVQQILQHHLVPKNIDKIMIGLHLINETYHHERTYFEFIKHVPPGHTLIAQKGRIHFEQYWDIDPEYRILYKHEEAYGEHFLELFSRAVAARLRTTLDTVGIFLSGGLDSCSVAAIAVRESFLKPGPYIQAGTFVFDTFQDVDERHFVQHMEKHLGLSVEYCNSEAFPIFLVDDNYESIEAPRLPDMASRDYLMQKLASLGANVVLTGHGGDSLIGTKRGLFLDKIRDGHFENVWTFTKSASRRGWSLSKIVYNGYYKGMLKPIIAGMLPANVVNRNRERKNKIALQHSYPWLTHKTISEIAQEQHMRHQNRFSQLRGFSWSARHKAMLDPGSVGTAVHSLDRYAAQHGMHARHPFLDRQLTEFVLSLPSEILQLNGVSKSLLRSTMKGRLPEEVRLRTSKTFFDSVYHYFLREKSGGVLRQLLSNSSHLERSGIVNSKEVRYNLLEPYLGGDNQLLTSVWQVITAELWLRKVLPE
jgi:asparagine synthase (glutamine-hydrolysing)